MRCTRDGIRINTFMLDESYYLRRFVERMMRVNGGRAFFTNADTLGDYVLVDFLDHRREPARRAELIDRDEGGNVLIDDRHGRHASCTSSLAERFARGRPRSTRTCSAAWRSQFRDGPSTVFLRTPGAPPTRPHGERRTPERVCYFDAGCRRRSCTTSCSFRAQAPRTTSTVRSPRWRRPGGKLVERGRMPRRPACPYAYVSDARRLSHRARTLGSTRPVLAPVEYALDAHRLRRQNEDGGVRLLSSSAAAGSARGRRRRSTRSARARTPVMVERTVATAILVASATG